MVSKIKRDGLDRNTNRFVYVIKDHSFYGKLSEDEKGFYVRNRCGNVLRRIRTGDVIEIGRKIYEVEL